MRRRSPWLKRYVRVLTPLLVVMLVWTLAACANEETPASGSIDPTPQIPPALAGTDVENVTGTVRKVSGLEFYRDSTNNYEVTFRPVAGTTIYVIVPDYDVSLELTPVELIDFLRAQVASQTETQDGLGIPAFLIRSSMPETYSEEGLRVVFSGAVGSNSHALKGLNRVPMRLAEIDAAAAP